MHIAIIDSGKIGATAAPRFVDAGHDGPLGEPLAVFVAGDDQEARDRLGAPR
jgi:predicted dinucleotide-binding enzyme